MINPSMELAKEILQTGDYQRMPIKMELYADTLTPIVALKKLKNISRHSFMFESAERSKQWGRYTFIGFDPTAEITCTNGGVQIKTDATTQVIQEHPATVLRRIVAENKAPILEEFPPFSGGLVGFFSYDYIKYAEPSLVLDAKDEEGFQDADLMIFDKIIAFDNYKQKIILMVNVKTDDLERNYKKGQLALEQMANILLKGEVSKNPPLKLKSDFRQLFDKEAYCNMVQKAKDYIYEGDIFQVVLSNRLEVDMEGSLLDTYRVLRTTNPSPYMFYFSSDNLEVAGASPETLVKLENSTLYTFPLAGTRPRGETPEEDARLEAELLADEKEIAEHNMLVDLGRNDIGRIATIGSVEVEKYMSIERFSHVMHIGSTVKGEIREDKDALDAIDSILPAGTLSGAPKLRALEIINELENNKRGIYGGAVGYIDFSGNLDTCIAIRLVFAKNGKAFVRSGAGIVADSNPESEYQECINKAKAVVEALYTAEGGIDFDFTH
ncbi:anthranilate synthase component I [Chakrabartyella piscis]|uniref:anthranilate synthase component I n=1 Tax=Chakrabartyella piscis TaxID=2918914 RepID=UPI00295898CC|nr:anthranilate synthase component I [Chakrabartyella piscis]